MAKRDYYIFNLNSNTKAIGNYGKLTLDSTTATNGHINFSAQNVVTAYTTNNWNIDNGYGSTTSFPSFQFEAPQVGLAGLNSIVVIKSQEYTTDLTFPNSGSYIDMCNEAVLDHAPSGTIAFDYTNFTNQNSYYSNTWYSQGYFTSSISLTSGYQNNELSSEWTVNWASSSTNETSDTAYATTAVDNAFNKLRQKDENDNLWHSVELSKILGTDTNSAVNFCDTDIQGTWNSPNDTYFSLKSFIDNFPENEITKKQLFQLCVSMVGATQPVYETLKYEVEQMLDNNEL